MRSVLRSLRCHLVRVGLNLDTQWIVSEDYTERRIHEPLEE